MKKSSRAIGVGVALSFLLAFAPVTPALAAAGAVWTNTGPCGSPQNVNQYEVNQEFYGHGSNFTPNATYGWVVKAPGANGAIIDSGTVTADADGHFCQMLFLVTSNMIGGPYQFQVGTAKNDNFKIVQGTTPPPPPSSCVLPSTTGQIQPFTFGSSGEPQLPTIFGWNGFGGIDVVNDQMNYQLWSVADPLATSVSFKVQVIGKYAAYNQNLGYYKAGDTGSFTHILFQNANTSGVDGNQGAPVTVTIPAADAASFGFADRPSDGSQWYSQNTLNWNQKDAMVAYSPAPNVYLLAFEDIGPGDNDYNDLVVKVYDFQCVR